MEQIASLVPSPYDARDYKYESLGFSLGELPNTLDMRNEILAVRNQGQDGACVAFTAACIKEVQERRDVNFDEYMSPQFIYLNREDKSTEGMYSRDLMRILTNIGSIPETMMPYQKVTNITSSMISAALNYRIKGYASIETIDGLKDALVRNGPALLGIPVYNYEQYIWEERPGDYFRGGHAVAVVGWTEEGFIIRNSWGPTWNGDGHTIFPFSHWGMQWEAWTTVDASSVEVVVVPVVEEPTPTELRRIRREEMRKRQEQLLRERKERLRQLLERIRSRIRSGPTVTQTRRRRRPVRRRATPTRRRNITQERMRRRRASQR